MSASTGPMVKACASVEALRELLRAELLDLVRRAVRAELQAAVRLTPAQREVLRAAVALYRPGEVFTASAMLDAAAFERAHKAALHRAVGSSAQRLGVALGQLVELRAECAGVRLARLPPEAGSRRWALEGVESL